MNNTISDFERKAWEYSDSQRENAIHDDIATAYYKGYKAGAKEFCEYLKSKYESSGGDGDFIFWIADKVINDGYEMNHEDED